MNFNQEERSSRTIIWARENNYNLKYMTKETNSDKKTLEKDLIQLNDKFLKKRI